MKQLPFDILTKCIGWDKQQYYMRELTRAILSGSKDKFLLIPDNDYNAAINCYNKRKEAEERLFRTAARNNAGIQLEKDGKTDEAIAVYEDNIKDGYPAYHSFQRLMIIYRKRKEYDNEIRVIQRGIEVFAPNTAGLEARLAKVLKLKEKQS